MEGKICNLQSEKGYGFIKCENGSEFFFHRSAVFNAQFHTLKLDMKVQFEPSSGPKGPRAECIEVLELM